MVGCALPDSAVMWLTRNAAVSGLPAQPPPPTRPNHGLPQASNQSLYGMDAAQVNMALSSSGFNGLGDTQQQMVRTPGMFGVTKLCTCQSSSKCVRTTVDMVGVALAVC